jgi:hypothetical protein
LQDWAYSFRELLRLLDARDERDGEEMISLV